MPWSPLKGGGKKSGGKRKAVTADSTMPAAPSNRKDLCIREISNGYVVQESGYRGGKYYTRETFTKTAPKIAINDGGNK